MGQLPNITEKREKAKLIPIGKAESGQINQWKNVHGNVYEFSVETEDSEHYCYLKEPDMDKFGAITSKMKEDELEATMMLIRTCWVGGDESMKTRVKLIAGIGKNMQVLLQSQGDSVKKL